MKRPIIMSGIAAVVVGGAAFAPAVVTTNVTAAPVVAIQRNAPRASRSVDRVSLDALREKSFRAEALAIEERKVAAEKAAAAKAAAIAAAKARDHARAIAAANAQARLNRLARERAAAIRAAAMKKAPRPVSTPKPVSNYTPSGIAACIAHFESGGNPQAHNPSGADGLYQFMAGTWNNYKGYSTASLAPASVQTEKFYQVWAGGAGAGNWTTAHLCGY